MGATTMRRNQALGYSWFTHMNGATEVSLAVQEARAAERSLIGQELHDNVNQILTSAKLYLEMLQPGKQKLIKERTIEYLLMAITEIKKISREWVHAKPDEIRFREKTIGLIEDLNLSTPIRFELELEESMETLPSEKKLQLFRILQEQLKNILNHSAATKVEIRVSRMDQQWVLEVHDNGVGFDITRMTGGVGLVSIHKRTHELNGTVNIHSSKGCGCTLLVAIPAA